MAERERRGLFTNSRDLSRHRRGWFSSTILYAALLLFPILLYIFFYQASRIDEATVRNFRSLGTAADRIEETLDTFHKISRNYSLGVDSTLLGDINDACKGNDCPWIETSEELLEVVQETKNQSILKPKPTTEALLRMCDKGDKGVADLPPPEQDHRHLIGACRKAFPDFPQSLRDKFQDQYYKVCGYRTRFAEGQFVSQDCQDLRQRDPRVYNALKESQYGEELIAILDHFGIEISMDAQKAFDEPTRHLSMFFDNYFIANDNGDIVFAGEPPPLSHDPHRRHRASVSFASLASIKDLLHDNSPEPLAILGSPRESKAHSNTELPAIGHSTVRHIEVDNVNLSVFIHPFTAGSSPWYVIGVIPHRSLTTEAIRLRLGPAVDATLAIVILLTLLPILRFWTSGNRSIFRRFNLYSVGVSVLGASALCTILLSGMISKSINNEALDHQLETIGNRIIAKFSNELTLVKGRLLDDRIEMDFALRNTRKPNDLMEWVFCPRSTSILSARGLRWADREQQWSQHPRWWPTSSYIIDNNGKRVMCKQYREDLPLRLELKFREYFAQAKQNKLGLYKIDSIVRGQKQTVASLAYKANGGRRVAVAIFKFLSVDGTVLPRPFQLAVIDKSGNTIFHSDEDRVSVSNFIDDTGNDAVVRAAINYEQGQKFDADYDGVPIRGYLKKLHPDVDWTLVIFRDHSLTDRVSSLATSLSIISWITTTLLILILPTLLIGMPRPHGRELLPSFIMAVTDGRLGMAGVAWGVLGLAILYELKGYELLLGLLWPAVVCIAIYSVAMYRLAGDLPTKEHTTDDQDQRIWIKVLVLISVVFSFSVVPMLSWHNYYRAELSVGLAAHLVQETRETMIEKRQDFDKHIENLLGVGKREYKDRLFRAFLEDIVSFYDDSEKALVAPPLCGSRQIQLDAQDQEDAHAGGRRSVGGVWPWLLEAQRFLVYSPLTYQVIWHRANNNDADVGCENIYSISDAVRHVIVVSDEEDGPSVELTYWLMVLMGAGVVLFLCYSAVRTKFGYARRITHLREVSPSEICKSSSRLLLIKRSDQDVARMVKELKRDGTNVVCDDAASIGSGEKSVFVIRDLRSVIADDAGAKLAKTISGMIGDQSVILCSDVVPPHQLDAGTLEPPDGAKQPLWADEWRELLGRFDVGVLRCEDSAARGDPAYRKGPQGRDFLGAEEVLAAERKANGDFGTTLDDLTHRLERGRLYERVASNAYKWWRFVGRWRRSSQLREEALRSVHAAVQSRFRALWAVSSMDERAQLYALAHGGSPNMRRSAAISSLVNRGLVTDTDPIRLRSEAFGQFIVENLDDSLDDWRRNGQGDWWRVAWLPLVLFAGLGLLFFINSNPEAVSVIAAMVAVFIGLVPLIASLFRVGQVGQLTVSSSDE